MPITIGSNISSLKVQGQLASATDKLSSTFQRLSSGLRINKAGDDAAGLAIASSLNLDERVYSQGIRNLNDGISIANVVDSVLQDISGIVTRLKELSSQSANGTYSKAQRVALDKEARALDAEVTRVIQATTFNGVKLLNGSLGSGIRLQGGYGLEQSQNITLGSIVGDGTFQAATTISDAAPSKGELGDINGDGILDLVTFSSASVATRIGVGDGTFSSATTYVLSGAGQLGGIELVDLNNDGRLDISVAKTNSALNIQTLLNAGDGTFQAAQLFTVSGVAVTSNVLTSGDFNADGIADLIYAAPNAGYTASIALVALGNGNGTFRNAGTYSFGSGIVAELTAADIDNDGKLDFIGSTGGDLTVFSGNGDGTFSVTTTALGGAAIIGSTVADINGDGFEDWIGRTAVDLQIKLGQGDGTFQAAVSYGTGINNSPTYSNIVSASDINNDGKLDLVTTGRVGVDGGVSILFGNGNGTFRAPATLSAVASGGDDFGSSALAGDINNDGAVDLVSVGTTNTGAGYIGSFLAQGGSGVQVLPRFSLTTRANSLKALTALSTYSDKLISQRSVIGAQLSRVQTQLSAIGISRDNFSSARATILDADIAGESAALVRQQILQQAGVAVLAQANNQPQISLQLLRI